MNPYHNAMHAVDVANSVGFFLINGLTNIFNQMECSSLVISALAHDLGHPGLEINNFFIKNFRLEQRFFGCYQKPLCNYM